MLDDKELIRHFLAQFKSTVYQIITIGKEGAIFNRAGKLVLLFINSEMVIMDVNKNSIVDMMPRFSSLSKIRMKTNKVGCGAKHLTGVF